MTAVSELRNLPDKMGNRAAAYAHYWMSLPKTDHVPRKSALDLGAMLRFAANFVIAERGDDGGFIYRLVGTAIREIVGYEQTGTDPIASRGHAQREPARVALNALLDVPCGVWGIVLLRSAAGLEFPAEICALPLRGEDGVIRFIGNTFDDAAAVRPANVPRVAEPMMHDWPAHRFIDIGCGLPRFATRKS